MTRRAVLLTVLGLFAVVLVFSISQTSTFDADWRAGGPSRPLASFADGANAAGSADTTREVLPAPANCPTSEPQQAQVQEARAFWRPADVASDPLVQTHALIPLEEWAADQQLTLDYYQGVEARRARFPNQNFVFAMEIRYPPFLIRAPNVVDKGDLQGWSLKSEQVRMLAESERWCQGAGASESALSRQLCSTRSPYDYVFYQHPYTSGNVDVFDHVEVGNHECGWMATPEIAKPLAISNSPPQYDKLASLAVPEGCSFQHFMDGVLPKIAAAMPVLLDPSIKIWMPSSCPKGDMVNQLYQHVGIDPSRLVPFSGTASVRRFYSVCDIPGWHPILWRQMRQLLRVSDVAPAVMRTKVVYLKRGQDARNGRLVINDQEIQNTVRQIAEKHNLEYVLFEHHNSPTVASLLELFAQARMVVGMHGGAFYNMMFAPPGLEVVEFLPLSVSFFLFHIMADMLDHRYWYLPTSTEDRVPADRAAQIVEAALTAPPPSPPSSPHYHRQTSQHQGSTRATGSVVQTLSQENAAT